MTEKVKPDGKVDYRLAEQSGGVWKPDEAVFLRSTLLRVGPEGDETP